jgi:monoamine oxidase
MVRGLYIFFMVLFVSSHASVAIVGGGLAGLSAAYYLQKDGIEVTVFEARERPGGRVLTYYDGSSSYDELGGKFLADGGEALEIRALLQELGLKTEVWDVPFTQQFYKDGKAYDFCEFVERAAHLLTEENYRALIAKAQQSKNSAEVLEWFLADHPDLLHRYKRTLTNFEGSPPEFLDTYAVDVFWFFFTHSYEAAAKKKKNQLHFYRVEYVQGGNSRLIQALCDRLQGCIHYRAALTGISKAGEKVRLDFEGRPSACFDQVILAIPCPVFKQIAIEEGSIPEDQLDAIHSLQYGTPSKILFRVQIREKDFPSFSFGSDFILWFNKDHTLMTLYSAGKEGLFDSKDLEKRVEACLAEIKVLIPSLKIIGEPVPLCWGYEPYSLGSYSNYGVGQFTLYTKRIPIGREEVKQVFRPVEGKIFFAGEHATLQYQGTMEGAVESGHRTARILLQSGMRSPSNANRTCTEM